MVVEQRLECIRQVADWVDVAHLAVGDEAGEQRPVFCADLVTGEECVLSGQGNFSDPIFDRVGVQFQPAVFQEPCQARPVRQGVSDVFCQLGGLRDARELGFKPRSEGLQAGGTTPRTVFSMA